MLRLIRLGGAALLAGLLTGILSACTITSEKPLLAASEGAAPLPDAFVFYPYEKSQDGYIRSGDPPATFHRKGHVYVGWNLPDTKGEIDVRLVPVGGDLLLAAQEPSTTNAIYGFARFADGVLTLALAPDRQTARAIERERHAAMPKARKALAGLGISPETSAITLTSRAALDYLAGMYVAGRLPMSPPVVGYISEDPEAVAPARLVPAGHHWIKVP